MNELWGGIANWCGGSLSENDGLSCHLARYLACRHELFAQVSVEGRLFVAVVVVRLSVCQFHSVYM